MSKRYILVLTEAQSEDLGSVFTSAERGREDWEYLVAQDQGDYEADDIAHTRVWHQREVATTSAVNDMLTLQMPWTEPDEALLVTLTADVSEEHAEWRRSRIALAEARKAGRVDLGDTQNVVDLCEALGVAEEAALGDSSDDELSALREALDLALARWPEIAEHTTPVVATTFSCTEHDPCVTVAECSENAGVIHNYT